MPDVVFPAIVILIKLGFRTVVEQSVDWFAFLKALISLPIDLAFLSLSYLSLIVALAPPAGVAPMSGKEVMVFFGGFVFAALLSTFFSKKSDANLAKGRYVMSVFHAVLGLFASAFPLYVSIKTLGIV